MQKIKFSLNSSSISNAVEQLKKYAEKIENIDEEIVEAVVDEGEDEARQNALEWYAYDSGELYRGIQGEKNGKSGRVMATAPHSAYVEFGTGIAGDRNQHPEKVAVGWAYDVNKHGDSGWFYLGDDGKYHWTKGMPARPFMYDTAQILRKSIPSIVKELLEKE